jgi:hypothetical protein
MEKTICVLIKLGCRMCISCTDSLRFAGAERTQYAPRQIHFTPRGSTFPIQWTTKEACPVPSRRGSPTRLIMV